MQSNRSCSILEGNGKIKKEGKRKTKESETIQKGETY